MRDTIAVKMASANTTLRRIRQNIPSSRLKFYRFSTTPCTYKVYKCPNLCVDTFAFCIRHILQDEKAPFQQCSFSYSFNSKRCPQAAPKCEVGDSYCPDHLNKLQRTRNRSGKSQPPLSAEKLLSSLSHYVKTTNDQQIDAKEADNAVDPFTDVDASRVNDSLSSALLDYCSESDSDIDTSILARTIRCKDEESSDAESLDSTGEDTLKFASVMTSDEVLQRAIEKTVRLKSLYADQLKRLKHVLEEKRRDYLASIQKEKETLSSIAEQKPNSPRELKLLDKLRGYNHYRKYHGVEAILRKKMKNKRKGLALDAQAARFGGTKCVFTEGGVKCSVRTLPNAKYCPKHILTDPFQVLFRQCGFVVDDNICKEPLPGMEPCIYHMGMIPAQISYNTALSSEDEEELKEEKDPNLSMEVKADSDTEPKNLTPTTDVTFEIMDAEFSVEEEIVVTNE